MTCTDAECAGGGLSDQSLCQPTHSTRAAQTTGTGGGRLAEDQLTPQPAGQLSFSVSLSVSLLSLSLPSLSLVKDIACMFTVKWSMHVHNVMYTMSCIQCHIYMYIV